MLQKNFFLSPSLILVSALTLGGFSTLLFGVDNARAGTLTTTIDFESGFSDLQPVSSVSLDGMQVTFSIGADTTGGTAPAKITEVGFPSTGFAPLCASRWSRNGDRSVNR